jgi:hypothetical protein
MQILYIEIQQSKVLIHGHTDDEITNLDFGEITLRVQGSEGAKADLKFVQTGSIHLGLGCRIDLVFHLISHDGDGLRVMDGFGCDFPLSHEAKSESL